MCNGGENWLASKKYGGDLIIFSTMYDIGFRKGIVDTLTAIGMDSEAIEEGIEKNANIWRDGSMRVAFHNQFEPVFFRNGEAQQLEPVDPKHKEAWFKMRTYEYYKRHKKSVDAYGIITPEMQMTKEEVMDIKTYLDKKNIERSNYLEEYRQQRDKKRTENKKQHTKTANSKSLYKKFRESFKR